jgi:hypothetical protein
MKRMGGMQMTKKGKRKMPNMMGALRGGGLPDLGGGNPFG